MRARIPLSNGFLLLMVAAAFIFVVGDALKAATDNITNIECLRAHTLEELLDYDCARVAQAIDVPLSTNDVIRGYVLLELAIDDANPDIVPGNPCDFFAQKESGRAMLARQLGAHQAFLLHGLRYGSLPEIDSCDEQFVSSGFLVSEALRDSQNGLNDLAALNLELAYLIDRWWKDDTQRGINTFNQSLVYLDEGEEKNAEEGFYRAINAFKQIDDEQSKSYEAWTYYYLGQIAHSRESLDEAELKYRKSIQTAPKDTLDSFKALVILKNNQGYGSEEIIIYLNDFRSSVDPLNPYMSVQSVKALLEIGAIDAADRFLGMAGAKVQKSPLVLGVRGELAYSSGDLVEAEHLFNQAMESFRVIDPIEAASWAVLLAETYKASGDLEQAKDSLEQAVILNESAHWYWLRLADVYFDLNEREEAETALNKASALDPGNLALQEAIEQLKSRNQ